MMCCVLLCILEAVEGGLCSLVVEVLEASEAPEVIRCMLLCILEAVEGGRCLLEVLKVLDVMRCVLLCMLEAVEGGLGFGKGFEISVVAVFSSQFAIPH